MFKFFNNASLPSVIILGMTLMLATRAVARDVEPTDSTAQSLPSTENTERYGCVSGYSDRTYQGEQPISRYEFAAGLNACLNQIQQRIDNNAADQVTSEDLAVPKRQLESLGLELERLRLRIDGLESRL
jgi:hypothetical protein